MNNGSKFFFAAAVIIIMLGIFAAAAVSNKKSDIQNTISVQDEQKEKNTALPIKSRGGYIAEIVGLYEEISGESVETDEKNPMFEDSSEEIVKAWKIGIIDDGDTAFYYGSSGLQYQAAAQLLYETIITLQPDFVIDENEARYWLNGCYNNIGIDEKNICGMAFLYKYDIADKTILPEDFVSDENVRTIIDGARRVFAQNKEVEIAGKKIKTGMSRAKLVHTLGSPNRIEESGSGFLWYVYNSNYAEFIMAGVYNDAVCAFFTNCRDFKFGEIKSGSFYADVQDESVKYYLDSEKKVDGVFFSTVKGDHINTVTSGIDITDIINAVRIKRGAGELYYSILEQDEIILDIFGKNVWDCYEKLIGSGYAAPFEFAKDSKGYIYARTAENDGNISIVLKASENGGAVREIENVIPEKINYKEINEEQSNLYAPKIQTPSEGDIFFNDIEVKLDLGMSNYYRLTVVDNETLEILVNSYIANSDKFILPSYLLNSGGDYILSVYTPDGKNSNFVEFEYGTAKAPEIMSPCDTVYGDAVDIIWDSGRYSECLVEIFDLKSNLIASSRISGENETEVSGINEGEYILRISALKKNTNNIKAYSEVNFNVKKSGVDIVYETPQNSYSQGSDSGVKFKSDKYERIFGENRKVYSSKKEADANIVKITVPVWKIEDGRKVSSSEDIMINKALASEVYEIFYEIYLGNERFPIKSVSAYSWRSTATGSRSQHSYGTAIDINSNENYCIYNSGRKIGSFYKPGENPYSIPKDGDVVRAFKSRGWTWGADWHSLKDYMHFSYLGG